MTEHHMQLVRPHRVAFADTDASGRIHWTSVFRWAELAEHDLLRQVGVTDVRRFPRRATEAVYHRPLACGDEIEIRLGVERAGQTSVTYSWHVQRDGELCVEGRHTVVHIDDAGRPAPWPEASLLIEIPAT
ncbi:acyl-CoA thioesterase [Saccharopolyspora shandongensis]|uniref:acyl-CoA thioesterase n=1 Tax=Saccharopolyspora shandongensis TaxID=418495 RepID=UPI0033EB65B0